MLVFERRYDYGQRIGGVVICHWEAVFPPQGDKQLLCLQASESRSMRGMRRLASDAASRFKEQQEAAGGDDTAHGSPVRGAVTRNGV